MKKTILRRSTVLAITAIMLAGLMLVALSSCADKSPAYWDYELVNSPSEEYIIDCLMKSKGIWVWGIEAVTEESDPNGMLNKAGGYTSCVYFESYLIDQTQFEETSIVEKGTDCGGCVEVYSSVKDAEKRNEYLSSFDGTIFSGGSHTVVGTVIIRVSDKLTATQQKAIETNIVSEMIYTEASPKKYKAEVTVDSMNFAKMMAETLYLSKESTIWELKKQGYSDENIVIILDACDIMWSELAINKANSIGVLLGTPGRRGVSGWLTNTYWFTEEEAQFAIQHCDIDWKNNLLAEWTMMCIEDVENAMYGITDELTLELSEDGFTEEDVEYAYGKSEALIDLILNWTGYDNNNKIELIKEQMSYRFSDEEIEFAIAVVQMFEDEINFME